MKKLLFTICLILPLSLLGQTKENPKSTPSNTIDAQQDSLQSKKGKPGTMTISRAYWIDEEGTERESLIIDEAVTLYIKFEGDYIAGQDMELVFEDVDDSGWKRIANCKGIINEDGIMTIPDFILEYELEIEETNND